MAIARHFPFWKRPRHPVAPTDSSRSVSPATGREAMVESRRLLIREGLLRRLPPWLTAVSIEGFDFFLRSILDTVDCLSRTS